MTGQREVAESGRPSEDHDMRTRLLAELPVTGGYGWPGSPPRYWRAGTDRQCFCCMAQESSRRYGDA
jgi:hypothetical protein